MRNIRFRLNKNWPNDALYDALTNWAQPTDVRGKCINGTPYIVLYQCRKRGGKDVAVSFTKREVVLL